MNPALQTDTFIPQNGTVDAVDRTAAGWILLTADAGVVVPKQGGWQPLGADEYRWSEVRVLSEHYLGLWNGKPICLAELAADSPLPVGWQAASLRAILPNLSREDFVVIGRAQQIVSWWRDHQWCGRCGKPTQPATTDRACQCTSCGALWYPRLTPCIIVLPVRGEELLLGHNAHFPKHMYSALAGFVEPGETLEQAMIREVREETSIQIANPRYFGSQPWPFPSQLMLGFFADYESGEPTPDGKEITATAWYHYRSLPKVPPQGFSIAGDLIAEAVRRLTAGH